MTTPERLIDKILEMQKEAGITSQLCKEEDCSRRYIGKTPEKSFGRRHCMYQIPFVRSLKDRSQISGYSIRLVELCEYKILEYWKK